MRYLILSMIALVAINFAAAAPPMPETASATGKIVKPGESHTNGDGVTVKNVKPGSRGKAKITPKEGDAKSKTKVKTWTNFEGEITGLDANDTVNLGSSNDAEISGNGGTINLQGGSNVTVTNAAGGSSMTVSLPSGTTVTIPPGSSATFNT